MKKQLKLFTFFIGLFFALHLSASEAIVKDKMVQYWNFFANAQFDKTADIIHPDDLEGMKQHLVPVFAQAAKSSNGEIAQLAKLFFGDISPDGYNSLSPKDVFIHFNEFLMALNSQLFEVTKGSTIKTDRVHYGSSDEATVYYTADLGGQTFSDNEEFHLYEGTWYIRAKESPKATAQKFKSLFELK